MHNEILQPNALPSGALHSGARDPALEAGERSLVCTTAKEWLGTPYHHEAFVKGKEGGVDCAFFLICVYHAAGLLPWLDPRPYPRDWNLHRDAERYLGWVKKFCGQVEEPQPGDLAVYRYGRTFSHGAIVLEWPMMIHSYSQQGVVYADGSRGEFAEQKNGDPREKKFYSIWKEPDSDHG